MSGVIIFIEEQLSLSTIQKEVIVSILGVCVLFLSCCLNIYNRKITGEFVESSQFIRCVNSRTFGGFIWKKNNYCFWCCCIYHRCCNGEYILCIFMSSCLHVFMFSFVFVCLHLNSIYELR